jgi:poly-gamma-glutamate synthesis protein (capsule biosynthesis protein)
VDVGVGVGGDFTTRGTPHLAGPDAAAEMLDRLQKLSAPLGTTIAVEQGVGVVVKE